MRKLILLLGVIFLFMSCSHKEEVLTEEVCSKYGVEKELKQLESFNESISKEFALGSRGLLTLLGTVSADIIGIQSGFNAASSVASFITALTGGTVGPVATLGVLAASGLIGAGTSYVAYKGCTLTAVPDVSFYDVVLDDLFSKVGLINSKVDLFKSEMSKMDLSQIDIATDVLDDDLCILTANLHNDIIDSTLVGNQARANLDPFVPIGPVEEYYDIPLFTTSEIRNMGIKTNDALKEYYSTYDYEETLLNMVQGKLISNEVANILKLFLNILHSSACEESLNLIINEYSDVVRNSENLEVTDKNALIISFITAKKSIELWEEQMRNQN